ncbi:hypothetical protein [Peribacillus simplex]|uniref:hypothetical protein n=1 Tax=Peribacillus simplex TaxID=1478 RepID=UPI003D277C11
MATADMLALLFLFGAGALLVTAIVFLVKKKFKKAFMMLGLMFASLILFITAVMFTDTGTEETTEEAEPELVELTATVETATFNKQKNTVSAIINTNLPEGTLARLHLQSEKQNAAGDGVSLLLDQETKVKDGKFTVTEVPLKYQEFPQENTPYTFSMDIEFGNGVGNGVNEGKEKIEDLYWNTSISEFDDHNTLSLDDADSFVVKEGYTSNEVKKMTAEQERLDAEQERLEKEKEAQELKDKKDNAKEVRYGELEKNPDAFAGEFVKFQGEIVQIIEDGTQADIRLAVTKDSYGYDFDDVVYVTYQGTTNFIEDDVITVYGTVQGGHTYESTAGYTITVPLIEAEILE